MSLQNIKATMICPLCSNSLNKIVDTHYFNCENCNSYVKDKKYFISEIEERKRYELHNNDINDIKYQNFTSPISNVIFKHYDTHHMGLDFGCGTGPVIAYVLKQKNYLVRLYDPFFYPDESYLQEKYDYIFSCEVFEHFKEPHIEISKLLNILKSGGRLIIMTHLLGENTPFETWYYKKDPTHIFIYTKETMGFIANKYALTIEYMDERLIVLLKK